MDFWLIVVIAFGAALVLGFGIVILRGRADAVRGTPSVSGGSDVTRVPAAPPPPVVDRQSLDDAVGALLAEGKLIHAVKLVREHTGFGLKDAKEYVDRLAAGASTQAVAPVRRSPETITPEAMARIQQLIAQGKKIHAIKELREHTGLGLKQAKDTVDRMEESGVVAALDVPSPAAADPTDEVMARVQALVADGKKIQAIKLLIENAPDLDLRRAKAIVDRL
ncbi:ribosomal protein L7/L12 [Jiangella alkaliphila]|uniref:Ribosomal protein L7/L12 C-terminal domain-containing protein n=1 Tax=Jiangella alkaliphila TaxID=419479 RepID=A0A1H2L1M0_9ACTN|nr:ribosomal protein L7/L12 [Jiangella alkaliphila]SDU74481.1 Ribosomal protein L7/L12 C-terminal domain-containing protein [Jiangella alkaliphila]